MKINLIKCPDPNCIDDLSDEPLSLMYLSSSLNSVGYNNVKINDLAGTVYNWK